MAGPDKVKCLIIMLAASRLLHSGLSRSRCISKMIIMESHTALTFLMVISISQPPRPCMQNVKCCAPDGHRQEQDGLHQSLCMTMRMCIGCVQ